ncbi:MAG: ACP S-malonyltransferase, partial [Anaerolineae bacterium]
MRHWDSEVLVLAGESRASLIEQGQRLSRFLESAPQIALRDLGYTLNTGLGGQPYRVALVGSSVDDLETKLERALEALADGRRARIKMRSGIYFFQEPLSRTGKLAFLFPGEGSQYVNMLRDLCLAFPEVRAWFDRIDQAFLQIGSKDYRPSALVFPPPASEAHSERNEQRIWDMDAAVAVVTTANLALLTLSRRLCIRPDALVGHSTGEYTALQAAGIMDVNGDEAFVQLAADMDGVYRQVAERDGIPRASLVAAGADAGTVSAILDRIHGGAFVAMDNCLHQTVVVGQQDAVRRFTEEAQQQGIICEALPFDRPYHTPLFEPYVDSMEPFFDRWITSLPKTQIYSCTTAAPFAADLTEIQELALQHWTRPVRFRQTIETMYADGVRVFVEVGPRGNLSAFVNDILRGQPHAAVPLNVQSRSGIAQLNHAVALLAAHAVPMELGHLYEDRRASALALEPGLGSQPRVEPMSTMTLALELPYLQLNQGGEERTGGQPSAPCEASWQADSAARDPESSSQASTDIQEAPSASATRRDPDLARERVEEASKAGSARDERPERGLQRSPSTGSRVEVQGDAPSVDTTGSTRSRVVHSYLWTMERFLEMQQEMMQRYLAHAGHGPSSDWSGEWSEGITG